MSKWEIIAENFTPDQEKKIVDVIDNVKTNLTYVRQLMSLLVIAFLILIVIALLK
jgi:hypothetical protein